MEAKKKNRISIAASVAILAIVVIGGLLIVSEKQNELKDISSENGSLSEVLEQRDSVVDELVNAFNDIESNLDSIRMKRNQLALAKQEGDIDQKEKILNSIQEINTMLDESSKKIASLEKKLSSSGFELKSFKNKIAELLRNIDQQNTEIDQLKKELGEREIAMKDMHEKMTVMEEVMAMAHDSIEEKDQAIIKKENELNEAYLAYGTYKELKDKGLLTRDGGFLWIGRNKTIQENFDDDYFIKLDIRETSEIPLHSKKAKIISEHPDSSYRFVEENGEIAYLEIEDPKEFWKISKYALIEVKD